MNATLKTPASGYSFITKERTQKLDLLQHLVANIARAVVVCGPEGVGKSRLLKHFRESAPDSWLFCAVDGDNKLSYEDLHQRLRETLIENLPTLNFQSTATLSETLSVRNVKVVLVIDDAGMLAPGLVDSLIAYTNGQPALRCILVLTHSELYLKNSTDPSVEDCYQIELPPLSEKQCGEFLEYLSTLPSPRIQYSSINDTSIAELYRDTHGIPGNILKYLPHPQTAKTKDYAKPVLILAVAGLIGVALGVQWWSEHRISKNVNNDPHTLQQKVNGQSEAKSGAVSVSNPMTIKPAQPEKTSVTEMPVQSPLPASAESASPAIEGKYVPRGPTSVSGSDSAGDSSAGAGNSANSEAFSSQTGADHPESIENRNQQVIKSTAEAGASWLTAEPAENYTLQLMALPDEQTAVQVIQRNQSAGDKLRYVKTKTKNGKERFILLYGSYLTPQEANGDTSKLPKELQKVWARKIGVVQQELFPPTLPNLAE